MVTHSSIVSMLPYLKVAVNYICSMSPCFHFTLLAVSEVIELSSGEEDTLHIVDSSESVSEEDEEEEKGGTHVNDVLNQRDALGRVLVNLNHPPEEENVFLAPQLARAVKPHQVQ